MESVKQIFDEHFDLEMELQRSVFELTSESTPIWIYGNEDMLFYDYKNNKLVTASGKEVTEQVQIIKIKESVGEYYLLTPLMFFKDNDDCLLYYDGEFNKLSEPIEYSKSFSHHWYDCKQQILFVIVD